MHFLFKMSFQGAEKSGKVKQHQGSSKDYRSYFSVLVITAMAFLCAIDPVYSKTPLDAANNLTAILAKQLAGASHASFVIKNLDNDSVVAAYNSDVLMNPASVTKLVTSAVAFETLSTNYTFKTYVYADSGAFDPATGICNGNLYIKAGGDPSLFAERLWLFVRYLQSSAGLTLISGDIVVDNSFFDTVSSIPCFDGAESVSNPYATPVNALSANFNCITIYVRPGAGSGASAAVRVFPNPDDEITIVSTAHTGTAGSENTCAVKTEKNGMGTRVVVTGNVPMGSNGTTITRTACQSWNYAGGLFKTLLRENGITCTGQIRNSRIPRSASAGKPLYVYQSPPLCDLVNGMMKYSNNFYAEMIFKTLSAIQDSGNGSWEKSSYMVQNWWKSRQLPGNPVIVNGSGLGDCNRISAAQLVALLSYVWKQKAYMPEYVAALPLAGVDGTLKSRFKGTPLESTVRGKTGTLNDFGVCTIAGYVMLPSATYAYAILFNSAPTQHSSQRWELQEKILELLLPQQ
jgi:D-alanyl-D-alanine carboxypeptidase/D-alanyl-D-alanine-endopeptidase (penicillin-binding protein 4)